MYDRQIQSTDFYPSYLQTYVERDVRQISNMGDLDSFIQFVRLCTGRTGQAVNFSSLATDAGISVTTAKNWISILQASYILYLLQPHHVNFNKRLTKTPKLYFYDTGLACSLLGLEAENQLQTHYLRGALFENFMLNELVKYRLNQGREPNYYFWMDKTGNEIDIIIDNAGQLRPIEIKSGKTILEDYFTNLKS